MGASSKTTCQSTCRLRSIFHARPGKLVSTNGEKCQIASFGQSSRRPPPAKPQPTAKGSAPHSPMPSGGIDRKSTRLNSSHVAISYAVFCLKKKKRKTSETRFRYEKYNPVSSYKN